MQLHALTCVAVWGSGPGARVEGAPGFRGAVKSALVTRVMPATARSLRARSTNTATTQGYGVYLIAAMA